ncbi:MAG: 3-dehydroquinate synthase [Verrucomicrobiota bacterium]
MAETLTVNLSERSYPITFGDDLWAAIGEAVEGIKSQGARVGTVVDENVAKYHAAGLAAALGGTPALSIPSGEGSKALASYGRALDFLAEERLDRRSVLLAIGGGVVGDLGGFAAASYLRGIDYIQVPTTLLSMVDSSVGGKTGINLKAGKNLVGAFHQPKAVYIATGLLRTLPAREFAAGMAEVIKYGLLGDGALFDELEAKPLTVNSPELAQTIRRCCAAKARVVEADERELAKEGGRALLNLGHTFGHAIENVAGYGGYLHGEAVAIGLCAAARLSQKLGYIGTPDVARIEKVVTAHALPTRLRGPLALADLHAAMTRDKKVRAGGLRFVVLKSLGEAATQSYVPLPLVEESFREVGAA